MSAKPDDRWAMELLDEVVPVLNKRTDEATERIRLFEEYLRRVGLAIPVHTAVLYPAQSGFIEMGQIVFSKRDDGWRVRWSGAECDGWPLLRWRAHEDSNPDSTIWSRAS